MLPLTIELKPSYYLASILLAIHIAAISVLSLTTLANSLKVVIVIFILLSLVYQLRRYAWLMHPKSICILGCNGAGEWYKISARSKQQKGIYFISVYLCSWLIIAIIKAQTSSKRYAAVLLKDSCSAHDWQHLRVILRTGTKIS